MRRFAPVLAALLGLWLVSARAPAQDAVPDSPLRTRLATIVAEAALGEQVSIAVVDASTGAPIFHHQEALALNPASNMKLLTSAAALSRLGAEHRMRTVLQGRVEGDGVATLSLRGFGDPGLRQADLVELARDLADHGVRRVGDAGPARRWQLPRHPGRVRLLRARCPRRTVFQDP